MEFAVALFGALMNNVLPKLLAAGSEMLSGIDAAEFKENAESIRRELGHIKATIQTVCQLSTARDSNPLQRFGLADLCCLAADIEDCIDSFHARKIKRRQYYRKIKGFRDSSRSQVERINGLSEAAKNLTSSSAQRQQHPAVAAQRQQHPAVAVPRILQDFLGNKDPCMLSYLNCLQYFCMFPCDHPVQRNSLIRRLLAEGLVTADPNNHPTLQQAAAGYLDRLITDKIITSIKTSNNGKVKRCQTPKDILQYISEDSVSMAFMGLCDHREQELGYVRRLSVRPGSAASRRDLNVPNEFGSVRTLAVFPAQNPVSYESVLDFSKYEVLRLLDLKECADVGKFHLHAICDLLMLKYLSLGDSIVRVPKKVVNLSMLMTLDLCRTVEVEVSSEILELPNLKHLLGKLRLVTADITVWPGRKTHLQKFLSSGSRLEVLSGFVTGKKQGFAMVLSHMKRLRKVKIWCNSRADEENLKAIKKGVEMFISVGVDRSLCIDFIECYGTFVESLEFRPAASTAHSPAAPPVVGSLSSLKLCGKLKNIPMFVKFMTDMTEVCLSWTNLSWDEIVLGLTVLEQLVYLKLEQEELALDIRISHLEALKRISLVGHNSLDIEIQAGALEHLVSLCLICETLGALPGSPGVAIGPMSGLKEIVLHSANTAIRGDWETAARAHGNNPNVSSADPST